MKDFKKIINVAVDSLLYVSGSNWLYSTFINRHRKILIVFYHEICRSNTILGEFSVNVTNFERQIIWLKKNYNIVSIKDLVKHITGEKMLSGNITAITFDGGYIGNYAYAFPVLKQYDCPATIYVITDPLDGKLPWHRKLMYLFSMADCQSLTFSYGNGKKFHMNMKTKYEKKLAREYIYKECLKMNEEERNRIMESLSEKMKLALAGLTQKVFLSWDQVREMRRSGLIDIGSHTLSHPRLTGISLNEARREILLSKQRIEDELGENIDSFCYPDGLFSPEIVNLVKDAGYSSALAVTTPYIWNDLNQVGDDVYILRRICMPDKSYKILLRSELSGTTRTVKKIGKNILQR